LKNLFSTYNIENDNNYDKEEKEKDAHSEIAFLEPFHPSISIFNIF